MAGARPRTEPRARVGRVREIELPPAARALCTLPRINYHDCWLVDARGTHGGAERFPRAMFDGAPAGTRKANPLARLVSAAIDPLHKPIVRRTLERTAAGFRGGSDFDPGLRHRAATASARDRSG